MGISNKKAKFTEQKSNKSTSLLIGGLVVVLVAVGAFFLLRKPAAIDGTNNVGVTENYAGKAIEMTQVEPQVTGNEVAFDLNQVKNDKIVAVDVKGMSFSNKGQNFDSMPLMAYISPQGNVVVARSLCEPCNGTRFHIQDNTLVCNACGTTWDLETLKGIAGGCPQYPPETVKYKINGDKIILDKEVLKNWQPRAV